MVFSRNASNVKLSNPFLVLIRPSNPGCMVGRISFRIISLKRLLSLLRSTAFFESFIDVTTVKRDTSFMSLRMMRSPKSGTKKDLPRLITRSISLRFAKRFRAYSILLQFPSLVFRACPEACPEYPGGNVRGRRVRVGFLVNYTIQKAFCALLLCAA